MNIFSRTRSSASARATLSEYTLENKKSSHRSGSAPSTPAPSPNQLYTPYDAKVRQVLDNIPSSASARATLSEYTLENKLTPCSRSSGSALSQNYKPSLNQVYTHYDDTTVREVLDDISLSDLAFAMELDDVLTCEMHTPSRPVTRHCKPLNIESRAHFSIKVESPRLVASCSEVACDATTTPSF
jgi:hypothetical protein